MIQYYVMHSGSFYWFVFGKTSERNIFCSVICSPHSPLAIKMKMHSHRIKIRISAWANVHRIWSHALWYDAFIVSAVHSYHCLPMLSFSILYIFFVAKFPFDGYDYEKFRRKTEDRSNSSFFLKSKMFISNTCYELVCNYFIICNVCAFCARIFSFSLAEMRYM